MTPPGQQPRRTFADPFLRRPVLSLVLSLLVLLLGALNLSSLQVETLPPIAPGRVTVRSSYPGGGAEVVEQGVTALLEQQLKGLERLERSAPAAVPTAARSPSASRQAIRS